LRALKDDDSMVRERAIEAMARQGQPCLESMLTFPPEPAWIPYLERVSGERAARRVLRKASLFDWNAIKWVELIEGGKYLDWAVEVLASWLRISWDWDCVTWIEQHKGKVSVRPVLVEVARSHWQSAIRESDLSPSYDAVCRMLEIRSDWFDEATLRAFANLRSHEVSIKVGEEKQDSSDISFIDYGGYYPRKHKGDPIYGRTTTDPSKLSALAQAALAKGQG